MMLPFLVSNYLDSYHLVSFVVITFDHLTKGALAQHFEYFISIHHVVVHDLERNMQG